MNELRLLVLDVDGVLTDGSIRVDREGDHAKAFHVRDGWAIKEFIRIPWQDTIEPPTPGKKFELS